MDEKTRTGPHIGEPHKARRWQVTLRSLFWLTTLLAVGLWLLRSQPHVLIVLALFFLVCGVAALERALYRWITGAEQRITFTERIVSSLHGILCGTICGGVVALAVMRILGAPVNIVYFLAAGGIVGAIAGWRNF